MPEKIAELHLPPVPQQPHHQRPLFHCYTVLAKSTEPLATPSR